MKLKIIAIGLLVCAAMLAGCKERSEMPPLDEGSSVTYSSAVSSSSGESSVTASGFSSASDGTSAVQPIESLAPHVHNYELKETVEPSCFRNGSKLFACECGDEYSEEIAAPGHNYSIKTTVEPDCVNQGYTRHSCEVCGESYEDEFVPPLDHTYGEWKTVKEATTSSDGEAQSSCSRCGNTLSEPLPRIQEPVTYDDFTSEVIRLVNIERENRGLSPLSENSTLGDYAQLRSEEIQRTFSHTRPDGTRAIDYVGKLGSFRTYGENIAMGQRTPEDVVNDWMNSEGHRANILKEGYTMIGVGCSFGGGAYYWVQIFGG